MINENVNRRYCRRILFHSDSETHIMWYTLTVARRKRQVNTVRGRAMMTRTFVSAVLVVCYER